MKIRLKDTHIIVEVSTFSEHYNTLEKRLQKMDFNKKHRIHFLKYVYFLCAKIANCHDLSFYNKLINSSHKAIELKALKTKKLTQYYSVLGAKVDDPMSVVKKKYLKLAKQYHPDKVACANNAKIKMYTTKFQMIQQAYETLKLQNAS